MQVGACAWKRSHQISNIPSSTISTVTTNSMARIAIKIGWHFVRERSLFLVNTHTLGRALQGNIDIIIDDKRIKWASTNDNNCWCDGKGHKIRCSGQQSNTVPSTARPEPLTSPSIWRVHQEASTEHWWLPALQLKSISTCHWKSELRSQMDAHSRVSLWVTICDFRLMSSRQCSALNAPNCWL